MAAMVKRLLLVVGGTMFSGTGVKWALEIAKKHGSEITALPLLDNESWKASLPMVMTTADASRMLESRPWEMAIRRSQRVIVELQQACAESRVSVRVSQPEGDVMEAIAGLWRSHDLVIFGLRGLFEAGIVPEPEEMAAHLIKTGVRPILAVSRHFRSIRRVLVAYSGSMESATALKQFVGTRLWAEAELEVACFGQKEAGAEPLLEDATTYCRAHGLHPSTVSIKESAIRRLLPYASERSVDLIVIGDDYRHVLTKNLLGDTMLHTARHSDIPLFISH